MRIAQILHNKAHWIFDPVAIFGMDEMPQLPPDPEGNPIVLVDITSNTEVQEGWDYDSETSRFTEPVIVPPEPLPPLPPSTAEKIDYLVTDALDKDEVALDQTLMLLNIQLNQELSGGGETL